MSSKRAVCLVGEFIFAHTFDSADRDKKIGKSHNLPFHHYDIYINGMCIGVTGQLEQRIAITPCTQRDFEDSHNVFKRIVIDKNISSSDVRVFIDNWEANHPQYRIVDDNCQKFANDFVKCFFGESFMTQTNEYGFYALCIAGASAGLAIVAGVVGFLAYRA